MPDQPKDEAVTQENTNLEAEGQQDSWQDQAEPQPEETPQADESPISSDDVSSTDGASESISPTVEPTPSVEPVPSAEPAAFASTPEAAPGSTAVFTTAPVTTPEPKKKRKKLLIGLISAGVAALLIGGGVLAYNFWYQNPDKVVSDALVNAITAKTVSATGLLEVETDDYKVKIELSGKNDMDANANVAVKLSYVADEIDITVDGEGIYSAEGDIYVKLNDVQALVDQIEKQSNGMASFDAFDTVIKKVDGNWIKIGKEDLGDVSEEYEKAQKCFADISKQLDEDAAFRRSVENEVKELYQNNQFIIVGDKLGSRTINGQGSLGYKLSTDAEIADTFFTEFADTQLGKKFQECNDDIAFEDIVSESAKKDDGTETQAEIWVSRFGHNLTELNLRADEDGTKGYLVVNPVFNKEEAVEIPTDVITFAELKADIEKAYNDYYTSYYEAYYGGSTGGSGTGVEFN